jgi:hypothetical protein
VQIPNAMLRCVVFLYESGADGKRRLVGTAFVVSMYLPGVPRTEQGTYLLTAKHIVETVHRAGKQLYARVNSRGPLEMALWAEALYEQERREKAGDKIDIIRVFDELRANPPESVVLLAEAMSKQQPSVVEGVKFVNLGGPENWIFHENPIVDAAVLPWQPAATVDVWPFPIKDSVTPELIAREGIGPGEDVFVVGLFSPRAGQTRNIPIIRVGNIAAMPDEPIETATGRQEAYLVELLSIGGLSGSPVFTYLGGIRREPSKDEKISVTARAGAIYLLGLMNGHWGIGSAQVDAVQDALDGGDRVNMGIAIVVPIARLLEILDYPRARAVWDKPKE